MLVKTTVFLFDNMSLEDFNLSLVKGSVDILTLTCFSEFSYKKRAFDAFCSPLMVVIELIGRLHSSGQVR